jgi:hypothetical protein
MHRRTVLKIGAGLGVAGAAGLAGYQVLPPAPSRDIQPVDLLARELYASLDAGQRADACVPYDHPLRQYHNRGVWGGGRDIMFGFSRRQRQLLTDLMHAGLSQDGRSRVPDQDFTYWSGVHAMRALICGDPASPPYQIVLTGAHVNLRVGGRSREGAAFGGPQVYGDQRGNGQAGLPGNTYRDQFLLGHQIFRGLSASQKELALLEAEPVQTSLELQGRGGSFPGIAVSQLDAGNRSLAHTLVDRIFATYPPDDVAYARACLEANGGVDGLSLSYYERGDDGRIAEAQVFRLEGPGAVLYFRGYPHVHAFINVAMDPAAPLSSGEPLGENPSWLDREGVQALFERALVAETNADLAYYPEDSIAGRLRPGLIRSGDIYALESWQEPVALVDVHGSTLTDLMAERIPGGEPDRARMYTIATSGYAARSLGERFGRVENRRRFPEGQGAMLRDVTVAYLERNGFA